MIGPSGRDEWVIWYLVIVLPLAVLAALGIGLLWWLG